jgi:hypothetical protein
VVLEKQLLDFLPLAQKKMTFQYRAVPVPTNALLLFFFNAANVTTTTRRGMLVSSTTDPTAYFYTHRACTCTWTRPFFVSTGIPFAAQPPLCRPRFFFLSLFLFR